MNETAHDFQTDLVIDENTLPVIEQITEEMPGGFFIYHADGDEELIFANKAMLRIFGCETLEQFKELTGYTFPGLVHDEDIDRVEGIITAQIAESPDNLDYVEYRIVRADGEVRWIMDYGHFVHTNNMGDLFYVFISDATEMKLEAQENKRKAEVIMGLAYDHETIMLVDLERFEVHPYAVGDDMAAPITAETQGAAAIKEAFEDYAKRYIIPDDRDAFLAAVDLESIEELLRHDTHFTMNFRVKDDSGAIQWLRLDIANIEDENRYTRLVIGVKIVTRQVRRLERQTEERLRIERERDEALQASSAKSAFLFNMSHDVRTPLNAIVGFSTLARKYLDDPERAAECLDSVDAASDHLIDLIDDVLDMSQIESGVLQIKTQPCNVVNQLEIVLELIDTPDVREKLDFKVEIDAPKTKVEADPLNLRRIFLKVLDNAVKYTKQGGSVSVKMTGHMTDEGTIGYVLTVADTGIGMSEEFLGRLFESFEREYNTTKSHQYGSGLGLSITKSLIDLMGGTIEVESKKGEGSTFTISLEFEVSEPDADMQGGLESHMDEQFVKRLAGKRVLVVEDNELNRIITETIMTEAGLEVEAVEDGTDAVRAIRCHPADYYDLVLMDIQMPIMNGYDATRAIRSIDREDVDRLPIVALSANSMDEDRRRSIESGMNAHFAKPIDVSGLLKVLSDYVD